MVARYEVVRTEISAHRVGANTTLCISKAGKLPELYSLPNAVADALADMLRGGAAAPKPAAEPWRVYVWQNVLTDWTNGLVVSVARSEQEARDEIKARDPAAAQELFDPEFRPLGQPARPTLQVLFNEDTKPDAWLVRGGG